MKNPTLIRTLRLALGAGLLALAAAGGGKPSASSVPSARVVLVAKDQAFHLEGQPELRNPPLTLKRGQTVELVLRNEDPKQVLHCFTIGAFDVKTTRDLDSGESETLTITPGERGVFTYACLMHPAMAGRVVVQ